MLVISIQIKDEFNLIDNGTANSSSASVVLVYFFVKTTFLFTILPLSVVPWMM